LSLRPTQWEATGQAVNLVVGAVAAELERVAPPAAGELAASTQSKAGKSSKR
jgi:hypothetical protein